MSLNINPGIYKESSPLGAADRNRWSDGNLVRFWKGQPEPIGGWHLEPLTGDIFYGIPRGIIDWTDLEIYQYLTNNNLPYHPLWEEGYVSIGDTHSTSKLLDGMSAEDTRFSGLKRECGLHELSGQSDFMI